MAHPVDVIVGRNIKIRRLSKGFSQTDLGQHLGVTFQQVQKYERGINRVGASRLLEIATVLETSVQSLFEGTSAPDTADRESPMRLIEDPQALRLVTSFAQIKSGNVRSSVLELTEAIAKRTRSSKRK